MNDSKWPKKMPEFSEEQIRMKDEFVHKWLEGFPKKYGAMEIFNQKYPAGIFKRFDKAHKPFWRTIEIGGVSAVIFRMKKWIIRNIQLLIFAKTY